MFCAFGGAECGRRIWDASYVESHTGATRKCLKRCFVSLPGERKAELAITFVFDRRAISTPLEQPRAASGMLRLLHSAQQERCPRIELHVVFRKLERDDANGVRAPIVHELHILKVIDPASIRRKHPG